MIEMDIEKIKEDFEKVPGFDIICPECGVKTRHIHDLKCPQCDDGRYVTWCPVCEQHWRLKQ